MSVRVVARIRPLQKAELDKDVIVTAEPSGIVKLPNPRNESEAFSFQFNSVYDHMATQQDIFDQEIAPTVKSLFKGLDVVIFAYGVTGTGKTHTMRGGKALADRGMIPRLLSSIYRRSRKVEKDSAGATTVQVSMSYYEIYCDRVYDLFEPPEKRTPAGLPIRDNGGKTVVVGLTERPCTTLRDFELLYDQANMNRSTSATKLNAHSSRSHAILSVKLTQVEGDQVRISTVSAIDLAGSEDNRRTDNGKERMVESAAINKSLFVLAQCVEAISRKQTRIPYRESRMTRILSLGQNDGITVMILQLAPIKSYHLDTLSSLNFANRTKKIEVNEIENQPFFRESAKLHPLGTSIVASNGPGNLHRQPLRQKSIATNALAADMPIKNEKAVKSFAVYADKCRSTTGPRPHLQKRSSNDLATAPVRPAKTIKSGETDRGGRVRQISTVTMTQESIEALIDRKVAEKLAAQTALTRPQSDSRSYPTELSSHVQARLDALERRMGAHGPEQSEGLQYLLMGKQHLLRNEDSSALKMFQLALPYFPDNQKLLTKMEMLEGRIARRAEVRAPVANRVPHTPSRDRVVRDAARSEETSGDVDRSMLEPEREDLAVDDEARDGDYAPSDSEDDLAHALTVNTHSSQTPRTKNLLRIINTRDVSQIRLLRGVGSKKAEAIVNALCTMADDANGACVKDLDQLGRLKGVGNKGIEQMRIGLVGGA